LISLGLLVGIFTFSGHPASQGTALGMHTCVLVT